MSALNIDSSLNREGLDRVGQGLKKGAVNTTKSRAAGIGQAIPVPCKFATFGIESKILIATCHFSMPVSFGWRVMKGQR